MASPQEQFVIKPIIQIGIPSLGIDLSYSNSALFMTLAAASAFLMFFYGMRGRHLVPSRWQMIPEYFHGMIAKMVDQNVGEHGYKYMPAILCLYLFVLFGNLLGMIPGGFTFTSQIIITFAMAFAVFLSVLVIGLVRHGWHFFSLFFPSGAPWWVGIILIPVEVISYLSRPVSLAVRLFANMTVGHMMLKVVGGFVAMLGVFGVLPVLFLVSITALEFLIAFIQAYVFAILTCVYLHEALELH
ncbi:MAG: F0F1 ATP synthase subunit A [Alphaproteobacteria bacterium]